MSMTPVDPPRGDVRHEHGFTLIEMLVTMVTGMVIIIATLSVLDISISESSRISERVDADQQGRLAMEKIVLELHSSCIDSQVTPIQEGSSKISLVFFNYVGSEPYVSQVVKHVIGLNVASGKLTDEAYKSTSEKVTEGGRTWTFLALPTSTQTLATNVSQSSGKPVFEYYAYAGGNLSTTALIPEASGEKLSVKQAEETAEVTIRFTAAPTFGRKPTTEQETTDHTADLSDAVVLRLDPASASGTNEPCE